VCENFATVMKPF